MSEIRNVGILCDGQLGRMMIEDGLKYRPDLNFYVLGENGTDSPSAQVGAHQIDGSIKDPAAIRDFVQRTGIQVLTTEIEHIDTFMPVELAEAGFNVQPSPYSIATIQDKFAQKAHLQIHGIPVAPFMHVGDQSTLAHAQEAFGSDLIIKLRRGGYDGRGNSNGGSQTTWESLQAEFGELNATENLYAEQKIRFQRELSVVGVRDMAGKVALYPVVEVQNKGNKICHIVKAPAEIDPRVTRGAVDLAYATIDIVEGAGVWAFEMFQDENDEAILNEIAPRVHNTGHWTDLGAETSQFEQHIRAITGAELGSTAMKVGAAAMINILSTADREFTLAMRSTQQGRGGHVRWYGKAPKADGSDRKIGHVTGVADTPAEAFANAKNLYELHTGLELEENA